MKWTAHTVGVGQLTQYSSVFGVSFLNLAQVIRLHSAHLSQPHQHSPSVLDVELANTLRELPIPPRKPRPRPLLRIHRLGQQIHVLVLPDFHPAALGNIQLSR